MYHWDRVFGALAVLVLVMGLTGYGLYAWLTPSARIDGDGAEKAAPNRQVTAEDLRPLARKDSEPKRAPERLPPLQAVPRESAASVAKKHETPFEVAATGLPGETPSEVAPAGPPDEPLGKAAAPEPSSTPTPAGEPSPEPVEPVARASEGPPSSAEDQAGQGAPAVSPEPARATVSPPRAEEAASELPAGKSGMPPTAQKKETEKGIFRLRGINISSPAVKRFELARAVWNNEPRGGLETIRWNADGAAGVCAFSEIKGRAGGTLYYRWLRNGRQVAKVRVGIGSDGWRSYSSKVINKAMTGTWAVELLDAQGRVLAPAEFTF